MNWLRVTHRSPCPVCERPDWCTVSADGRYTHCMRVESDKAASGDAGGWIHKTNRAPMTSTKEIPKLRPEQVHSLAKSMYEHPRASFHRPVLAKSLGVTVASLERLRVGYGRDRDGREFASFPSRNSRGKVIGITRRYESGEKKTYPGTTNGLFFAPRCMRDPGPLFLPEGASDVAAFLSLGLCAIGRPSCTGGVALLLPLVTHARQHGRLVIVVGERDSQPEKRGQLKSCPADCKGCSHCWPGLAGPRAVANALGCNFALPPVGFKDFRDYARSGGVWRSVLKMMETK